jgi:hypothetical protein
MSDYLERAEESRERNEGLHYEEYHERRTVTDTPNYWDMPDEALALNYRALLALTEFSSESEEQLLFAEDAIMQRIGAPEDADPSVDLRWAQAVNDWADKTSAVKT